MLIVAEVLQMLRALARQPERERNGMIGLARIRESLLDRFMPNKLGLRVDSVQPHLEPERATLKVHVRRQPNHLPALAGRVDRNQRVHAATDFVASAENSARMPFFLRVRTVHRSRLRRIAGTLEATRQISKPLRRKHLSTFAVWKLWIVNYEKMLMRRRFGRLRAAALLVVLGACSKDEEARRDMRQIRFHQLEVQERYNALTPRQHQLMAQITNLLATTPNDERKLDSLLELATKR